MNFNLVHGCEELIQDKYCIGGKLKTTTLLIDDPVQACHDWCQSATVNFVGNLCCEWYPGGNLCGLWYGVTENKDGYFSGVCREKGERYTMILKVRRENCVNYSLL